MAESRYGGNKWELQLTDVVYRIKCQECGAVYVGQTGRKLLQRQKEHIRNVRKRLKQTQEGAEDDDNVHSSGVALHFSNPMTTCNIDNSLWVVLDIIPEKDKRLKKEQEYIKLYRSMMFTVMNIV